MIIIFIFLIFLLGEPEFKKQFSDVFNLVTALWGQLVEAKEEEEEEEESIYWTMAERKRRLSKWFQNVLKQEEEDEEVQCVCVRACMSWSCRICQCL